MPTNTGGHAQALSDYENSRGFNSTCYSFDSPPFGISVQHILFVASDGTLRRELKRWKLFLASIFKYDVFHFNFGQKFFLFEVRRSKQGDTWTEAVLRILYWAYTKLVGTLDLRILKLLGKKIFVTWQGDDVRQGDFVRRHFAIHFADEVENGYYDSYSDARKRRLVAVFDRFSDGMYCLNPDLMHVLPGRTKFIPYCHTGGLNLAPMFPASRKFSSENPFLVLHAPSHRGTKGTRYVISAIEQLKREGCAIDLCLVESTERSKAIEIYRKADLLVDQVLAGWYGGLAIELMALGKPVCAYVREGDLNFVPEKMRNELPIIRSTPDSLCSVLREIYKNPAILPEIGRKSREFFEEYHSIENVGGAICRDYERSIGLGRSAR